ncbi:glutathione S-transferase U10-like [Lycium ferocissimum]|uniref:glutathione S-transferase U10-like n=1 Tax=Lycium ferocissimum TaxID=112874 RepID=UPI00281552B5|nr:glutathione S-transferase U10-like [Lycium ferocissimum]
MEKESEVFLLGSWFSSYCTRVRLALEIKGIQYEYIEQDLTNKSQELLKYNPVHKKVPVLVHKGKPIVESIVILEYIDDCWKTAPKLLPEEPSERAKVRFWINYYDQKVGPSTKVVLVCNGKERDKAIEESNELLKVLEEGIARDIPNRSPFLNGENPGILDVVIGSSACNVEAFNEAIGGVDLSLEKYPCLFELVTVLKNSPIMKKSLPPHIDLVAKIREKFNLNQDA